MTAGDILEGSLRLGMWTQTLGVNQQRSLQVAGIATVGPLPGYHADVGLLFEGIREKATLEHMLPQNSILTLWLQQPKANG